MSRAARRPALPPARRTRSRRAERTSSMRMRSRATRRTSRDVRGERQHHASQGQNATCTIVENDIGPRLRVITQGRQRRRRDAGAGQLHRPPHGDGDELPVRSPARPPGALHARRRASLHDLGDAAARLHGDDQRGLRGKRDDHARARRRPVVHDHAQRRRAHAQGRHQVVNDAGGTRAPADFTARVTGRRRTSAPPGTSTGTTYTLRAARQYTVAADAVPATRRGHRELRGERNDHARARPEPHVHDHGERTAPTLKVVTQVVNEDGGTRRASAFTARVTGTRPTQRARQHDRHDVHARRRRASTRSRWTRSAATRRRSAETARRTGRSRSSSRRTRPARSRSNDVAPVSA